MAQEYTSRYKVVRSMYCRHSLCKLPREVVVGFKLANVGTYAVALGTNEDIGTRAGP